MAERGPDEQEILPSWTVFVVAFSPDFQT
jgi:hypothetical protein